MSQVAQIIKYEGDNNTFIWKHPVEDFNSLTQLIVHESQEAVFFMNGQALDLFGAGRYTLETQNIPEIGKALNRTTGDQTPFHCEVYFINKSVQMGLKWGTDSRVRFIDPTYGVPLDIGASGEMNLQVSDSRKLLVKLVGTMNGIAWEQQNTNFTKSLQNSFRPIISTVVKANLAATIKTERINILEIDERLESLSQALHGKVCAGFEEYGLTVPQFYVTTVVLPESDPNFRRIRDLHTVTLQTRMAEAETAVRTAQAASEASVTAARRQVSVEQETTKTEVERLSAERELLRAQIEADRQRVEAQAEADRRRIEGFAAAEVIAAQGRAEAEVMRAKGYSEKDVLQAEVQKAYAEGIGNMGSGSGGSGGNMMGDMLGLGVGMAAAGTVGAQMSEMMKGFALGAQPQAPAAPTGSAACAKCGSPLPDNAKFCLQCGEKVALAVGACICPACGQSVPVGKFCPECGHRFVTVCPKCGTESNGAKFCPECGERF